MRMDLLIGDYAHSGWSLRGWLVFDAFGLPVRTEVATLYTPGFAETLAHWHPARTAPALRLPGGTVIAESLAIAEEVAARHPGAGHWPADPKARAVARALAAEMHAGFAALREHCPMHLRVSYTQCDPPPAMRADLARLEAIWAWARGETGVAGPWLCGEYSVADAVFAPVATRIATYALPVGAAAADYVAAHLAHPSFRRWRAMAMVHGPDQPYYRRDWQRRPWPGPAPLPARAVEGTEAENAACPCSGAPMTHVLERGGRRFGFCSAFCRDKTAADPEAWPSFMSLFRLYQS
jgi:glutathione S-transferase